MRILFCDTIAGVSGNMFAASFLNAGIVTENEIKKIPGEINLHDYEIKIKKVTRSSLFAHHLSVRRNKIKLKSNERVNTVQNANHHEHDQPHYSYLNIIRQIDHSDLNQNVKKISNGIYKLLAEAEAKVHGISVDKVMFHEVGEPDSIIDVVLAGYCIDKADFDRAFSTPVKLGRGMIKIKHGVYPVPPPASILLAEDMNVEPIPEEIKEQNIELVTPTGLSILKYLKPEFVKELPTGKIKAHGYGAGTINFKSYPNVFRIVLIESEDEKFDLPYLKDSVVEISCNIDDQAAEKTAWCLEQLFVLGALDAWISTVYTKKNRTAFCLSVLATEDDKNKFADWLLRNTTTFGVRYRKWDRLILDRKFEKRKIDDQHEITHKIGLTTTGEELKAKPEFEEIRKIWDKKSYNRDNY